MQKYNICLNFDGIIVFDWEEAIRTKIKSYNLILNMKSQKVKKNLEKIALKARLNELFRG